MIKLTSFNLFLIFVIFFFKNGFVSYSHRLREDVENLKPDSENKTITDSEDEQERM